MNEANRKKPDISRSDELTPVNNDLKRALAHVLWIGGATDAGKSTVAGIVACAAGEFRFAERKAAIMEPSSSD